MRAKSFGKFVGIVAAFAMIITSLFTNLAVNAQSAKNPLDGIVYVSPQGAAYNARWDGWRLYQPDLPEQSQRVAFEITVTLPGNVRLIWNSVECFGATPVGQVVARENGQELFFETDTQVKVRCLQSQSGGFSVQSKEYQTTVNTGSTNPLAGMRFTSDMGDKYSAVWSGSDGWWLNQDSLPSSRAAHSVTVWLWPGLSYRFNGKICKLLNEKNATVVENGNELDFSTPAGNDVVKYVVFCRGGSSSGFSIETLNPLEVKPTIQITDKQWGEYGKLLAKKNATSTPMPTTIASIKFTPTPGGNTANNGK